jgi:hypothetical protein
VRAGGGRRKIKGCGDVEVYVYLRRRRRRSISTFSNLLEIARASFVPDTPALVYS